ncbi:MAG: hypothetical protein AMXMBFR77_26720 [Phycisphaerales bacterium]
MGCCGSVARSIAAAPTRRLVEVAVRLRVLPTLDETDPEAEARVAACAVCPAARVVSRFRRVVRCSGCECDVAIVRGGAWMPHAKSRVRRATCPRNRW